MGCRYVGTVRLRVEGVVGSLSDASATLNYLCFTRALIASAGSKAEPRPAAGRASNSPSAVEREERSVKRALRILEQNARLREC